MGANLAPSTTLPFINSALYVPFGGTSLGRLSINKASACGASELDFTVISNNSLLMLLKGLEALQNKIG